MSIAIVLVLLSAVCLSLIGTILALYLQSPVPAVAASPATIPVPTTSTTTTTPVPTTTTSMPTTSTPVSTTTTSTTPVSTTTTTTPVSTTSTTTTTTTPVPTTTTTSTPAPGPQCNKTACNEVMYDWVVNKYWAFDTAGFAECTGCPRRRFDNTGYRLGDESLVNFGGRVFKQVAYDAMKHY